MAMAMEYVIIVEELEIVIEQERKKARERKIEVGTKIKGIVILSPSSYE